MKIHILFIPLYVALFFYSCNKTQPLSCKDLTISLDVPVDSITPWSNIILRGKPSINVAKTYWIDKDGNKTFGERLYLNNVKKENAGTYKFVATYADCTTEKSYELKVKKRVYIPSCVSNGTLIHKNLLSNLTLAGTNKFSSTIIFSFNVSDAGGYTNQHLTLVMLDDANTYDGLYPTSQNNISTTYPIYVRYDNLFGLYGTYNNDKITFQDIGNYTYIEFCDLPVHENNLIDTISASIKLPKSYF